MTDTNLSLSILENSAVNALTVTASTALVFYNWFICLDQQIEFIWTRKLAGPALLFYLIQSTQLSICANAVFSLFGPQSVTICRVTSIIDMSLTVIYFLIVAVFSSLRVWAISGKQWVPPSIAFFFGLVPGGIELYSSMVQQMDGISSLPAPYGGCSWKEPISAGTNIALAVCARSSAIMLDMIILFITWRHTYRSSKFAWEAGAPSKLYDLLLTDGTLYFIAMLAINIAQLSVNLPLIKSPSFYNYVCPITIAMSSVLISRFILNLRSITSKEPNETVTFQSVIEFAVGNMGEDLLVSSTDYATHTRSESLVDA